MSTVLTLDQADKKLADLEREQASLQADIEATESAIAAAWGKDTSALEDQHGRLASRLQASKHVFDTLQAEREEALHREALATFESTKKEYQAALVENGSAEQALAAAQHTLKAAQERARHSESNMVHAQGVLRRAAAAAGVPSPLD